MNENGTQNKTILEENIEQCIICGLSNNIHLHHVYGGCRRKISDKYKLLVPLCSNHHNGSNKGVHFNKELDNYIKQNSQIKAMEYYNWGMKEWLSLFGKNYKED